jgi:hypothetical protein
MGGRGHLPDLICEHHSTPKSAFVWSVHWGMDCALINASRRSQRLVGAAASGLGRFPQFHAAPQMIHRIRSLCFLRVANFYINFWLGASRAPCASLS